MSTPGNDDPADEMHRHGLSLLDVARSVGAAFFGVQTEANRRRDFTHGRIHHFVLVGFAATVAFVLVLVGIVQLILATAGA